MKKKIVGISTDFVTGNHFFSQRDFIVGVYSDYVKAVSLAGGIPLLLPPIADEEEIGMQLDQIDVLLISGGGDVDSQIYGEKPCSQLERVIPKRDSYELQLVRLADEKKKRILGICRGMQIINVAFGGTLHQDISQLPVPKIVHDSRDFFPDVYHEVQVFEPSYLYESVKQHQIQVNSFHHQAVKILAEGFSPNAVASDGIIEGIERRGEIPILGVQWHPERMAVGGGLMVDLLRSFIHADFKPH